MATLTPDGRAAHLVSSLGSSSDEQAWDVALTGSGAGRVSGFTGSSNFPGGSPPPGGTSNAFVIALDGLTTPGGAPVVEQRQVSYGYDPVQRLTEATETPGTSKRYSYDLVGNRTQVWITGAPQPARTYTAANQVVGWRYDAVGNLLHDGTRSLTYDARLPPRPRTLSPAAVYRRPGSWFRELTAIMPWIRASARGTTHPAYPQLVSLTSLTHHHGGRGDSGSADAGAPMRAGVCAPGALRAWAIADQPGLEDAAVSCGTPSNLSRSGVNFDAHLSAGRARMEVRPPNETCPDQARTQPRAAGRRSRVAVPGDSATRNAGRPPGPPDLRNRSPARVRRY